MPWFMNEGGSSLEEVLFEAVLRTRSPAERAAFLEEVCRGYPELRARLEVLLEAHFRAEGFLDREPRADALSPAPDEPPPPAIEPLASLNIGRYKLLEKIGEGGMGEVWMAEQEKPVLRRVALKLIKVGMDTPSVVARFEAEGQALALMAHPSIAQVFDAGATASGRPYLVMELVRGIKITEYCDQQQLPTQDRLRLFIQVCHAIQHAHQKGIIHRDVKPSNILITVNDGVPMPKVIDFGIAKAVAFKLTDKTLFTEFQALVGTPAYLSPEQAEMSSAEIDTRSDIYSLGVLLYELLVGQTPFDARELIKGGLDALRQAIREKEPIKPSTRLRTLTASELTTTAQRRRTEALKLTNQLRGDLDWIVMKCLEKDRARRYATANGLAMEIQRYLDNEPVLARPPSWLYRARKQVRRNKLASAAAAVVVLALGAVATLSLVYAAREQAVGRQLENDLARQHLMLGRSLCQQGEIARGLHWMARALESAPPSNLELNSTVRQNLAGWSAELQAPLAVLPHGARVGTVAYSPDGSRLLTGSENTAKLWRADTGELIGQPMRHDGGVRFVAFSPDGQRLLTASTDKAVRLWAGLDAKPLERVFHLQAEPTAALFSPDGTRVFAVGQDGAARLWDASTGEPIGPWFHHKSGVHAAAWAPHGNLIATGGADGSVRFWSGDTGETRGEPLHVSKKVNALVFSPDGHALLTGSDNDTAQLWSVARRQPIGPPLPHRGRVNAVGFSPDGTRLLTANEAGVARLWSAANGEPLGFEMQHGAPVLVARFTPDGQRVVTGSMNNSARVWSAETGEPLGPAIQHEGWVWALAISPDGNRLLTGADDHSSKLWSIAPSGNSERVFKHANVAWSATFSPDGKWIVVSGADNETSFSSLRLWSTQTGKPGAVIAHPGLVWSVAFSPDGQWLLSGGNDGVARLWSTQTMKPSPIQFQHRAAVRSVAFSRDSQAAATASFDNTATVWSVVMGKALFAPFQHPRGVEDVAFSPDGKMLATACEDGAARLWSVLTGRQCGPAFWHHGSVLAVAFSPDGRQLLTGSTDNSARRWDVRTGKTVGPALAHPSWVEDVAFSPDGACVATCDAFDSAWLWSTRTAELLCPPFKHSGPVNEIEFSRDGRQLLTASHDGTARIWDIPRPFNGPVDRARQWVEAVTGRAMDEQGAVNWLDAATWRARRKEFGLENSLLIPRANTSKSGQSGN